MKLLMLIQIKHVHVAHYLLASFINFLVRIRGGTVSRLWVLVSWQLSVSFVSENCRFTDSIVVDARKSLFSGA